MKVYISSHVQQVIDLHRPILERRIPYDTVLEQLTLFAENLYQQFLVQNPAVIIELSNWHPTVIGKKPDEIGKMKLDLPDFQLAIARSYGFKNWEGVQANGKLEFNESFEEAVQALIYGDKNMLTSLLQANPNLINQRSSYQHNASLIHYLGSNGIETWRQVVPENLVEMAQLLLDYGADPLMESNIYGGTKGVLPLIETSDHPYKAGIAQALINLLSSPV